MKRMFEARIGFLRAGVSMLDACRRLLRDEHGNAIVEGALCISLMGMPLLAGTVEMGIMTYNSIEVSNAAHAGAMYGMISSTFAGDTAGITSAAQAEATDVGASLVVTPNIYFACSGSVAGTQYATQSAANAACTGSVNHTLEFVQVSTSTTETPPNHAPGLPASYTLTGNSVMEVQE